MSILLPVVLSGLAGLALADNRTAGASDLSPLHAFAERKTQALATANLPVRFTFDAASNTLRATATLPQVFPRLKSRLLGDALMCDYADALSHDAELAALAAQGVSIEYALVDTNRTPISTLTLS